MRTWKMSFLALAVMALAWLAAEAKANPYAEYNRQRALRLFYTSPSPYRTYSGSIPGYVREYGTPYGYARDWQAPVYQHRRITPYGYERYDGPVIRGSEYAVYPPVVTPYSLRAYPPPY